MIERDIRVREAGAGDFDSIVELCATSLGWRAGGWDRALFAWKHNRNAFGESLVLIAENESGILAVRPLMMWRFSCLEGSIRAARAVDTATRPDARGQGLFSLLNQAGLDRLKRSGIAFLFNTPNSQSRSGYLRMGWHNAGPVPFGIRVRSLRTAPRVLRSKVAATKPSEPTPDLGMDSGDFLRGLTEIPSRTGRRWRTDHDRRSLLWRYADGPVEYRALPMSDTAGAIVRVRRRGHARELLVAEQIGEVPEHVERAVLIDALHQTKSTHFIGATRTPGTVTSSRVGPGLTMREISSYTPKPEDMAWAPGDLELF